MAGLQYDIQHAGERVVLEYRGFPSLNNLSQALSGVQERMFKAQGEVYRSYITDPLLGPLQQIADNTASMASSPSVIAAPDVYNKFAS